jgi:hypothetical protein
MQWINPENLTTILLRITPTLFEWAVILLPLTVYLLWLGFEVGRKRHPHVLSGTRDTFLLVLALSGFLFIGPFSWVISRFAESGVKTYALAYAAYFVIIGLLCFWWMKSRAQSLVVYNIDPNAFQLVFRPILDNLNMNYQMTPGRIALAGQQLLIDFEATTALYCVTMSWVGDASLWKRIESSLRSALAEINTDRNPAGAIVPLYAALLLCFVTMSTVLFVWYFAFIF